MKRNFLQITQSIYSGFPLTGSDGADFSLSGQIDNRICDGYGGSIAEAVNYCQIVNPAKTESATNLTLTATDNTAGLNSIAKAADYFTILNPPAGSLGQWSITSTPPKPMFPVTHHFQLKKDEGYELNLLGVDKDRISVEITQLEASISAKVTVKADEGSRFWPLGNEQAFFFSKDCLFDKFTVEHKDGLLTVRAIKKVIPVVKPKVKTLEIE